jgi:hypothetical protein
MQQLPDDLYRGGSSSMCNQDHHLLCEKGNNPPELELEFLLQCENSGTSRKKISKTTKKLSNRSTEHISGEVHISRRDADTSKKAEEKEIEKIVAYWSKINARNTGVDFVELFSHGLYIVAMAYNTHNPEKGRFIDHVFNRVKRELYKYAIRESKIKDIDELDEAQCIDFNSPERVYAFRELINGLGPSAKTLVQVLFNCPEEIFTVCPDKPTKMRKLLVRKTQELYGGSVLRWYRGLKEIQTALDL